ncbi:hypothetical protein ACFYNO_19060 [Kitasatospora sp. NPDC006697]|uniref:hypothetical protein n=1 Tax=Kitasatospora sp. NPDC006697 TaxID=3364020 RepID=UPI0036A25134
MSSSKSPRVPNGNASRVLAGMDGRRTRWSGVAGRVAARLVAAEEADGWQPDAATTSPAAATPTTDPAERT